MGRDERIRDDKSAVDATAMIRRARRATLWKLFFQLIGWAILIALVVLAWRCFTGILDYSGQTEVPLVTPEETAPEN